MNKPLFWIGIAIMAITVILLLTVKEDINLTVLLIIGICAIGASEYEPLKRKK